MKQKILILAVTVAAAAIFAYAQLKKENFAPASDFPRGALVYIQIEDLPAFIRLWNGSELKKKYLESKNARDFSNSHLGRKLLSRWREFSAAAGVDLDLETVAGFSDSGAAAAVYDIGRLEFVFIAPVSGEIFAATRELLQNRGDFIGESLPDGTEIFRAAVDADRGRQKQDLLFAHAKDRLIIATSENLLEQTLKNTAGERSKNRLIDAPQFAALKDKTAIRTAGVWIDQAALSDDYYFRRYWLMSEIEDLKNIRAGIFDFEIGKDRLIERRHFLLKEPETVEPLGREAAEEVLSFMPETASYSRLKKADPKTLAEAVRQTIFTREAVTARDLKQVPEYRSGAGGDEEYYDYYNDLSEKYDESIDDAEDYTEVPARQRSRADLAAAFDQSGARAVLTFAEPELLPAPLFARFKRGAVFKLDSPRNFSRRTFETAIIRELLRMAAIEDHGAGLEWKNASTAGLTGRRLKLPAPGISVDYVLRGNILILTNESDYLPAIISAENKAGIGSADFAELTAINLENRKDVFERVFLAIGEDETGDFFAGNIASLLDSAGDVKKIEIRKNYAGSVLEEEIVFYK